MSAKREEKEEKLRGRRQIVLPWSGSASMEVVMIWMLTPSIPVHVRWRRLEGGVTPATSVLRGKEHRTSRPGPTGSRTSETGLLREEYRTRSRRLLGYGEGDTVVLRSILEEASAIELVRVVVSGQSEMR